MNREPIQGAALGRASLHPQTASLHPPEGPENLDSSISALVSQGAAGAAPGAAFFTLADAVQLTGIKRQPLSRRLERLGMLQDRLSESGPNKGRMEKAISEEDLFRVYPDALRVWASRRSTQAALAQPPAPTIAAPQDPAAIQAMKDWQRQRMDARLGLLRHMELLMQEHGLSRERALARLVADADARRLPEEVQRLVPLANARSGQSGARTLSRRTLQRWAAEAKQGFDHLAPKAPPSPVPSWLPQLLAIYRQPQSPSLSWAVQMLAAQMPDGAKAPSYDAARRALAKVGNVDREKGRMLPRELKSIKPFRRREKPEFPFDVLIADGHTFDAEIAHPDHGRPFRPELTVVVDVCTSRVVGWSAWEKENTWAVQDALRQAVLFGGIPLIFYTDNGPGYKNERLQALETRVGIEHKFGIPYNSQARGVVERLQKTLWIDLGAKSFATYLGAQMDREARQIVFKASRKGEPVLPSWQTFVAFMELAVEAYNARPSRACPKGLNAETGRNQHLSPSSYWRHHESLGWKPEGGHLSLEDFRPEEIRKVLRGEISLFGNRYFSRELAELHGDQVRVAFDIHDASRIWVRNMAGELICEAGFQANQSAYFPKPYVEQLREQRKDGQRKRLEAKAERVLGEPLEPIEIRDLTPQALEASEAQMRKLGLREPIAEPEPLQMPEAPIPVRPAFQDSREYACWILDHPAEADPTELEEIQSRLRLDPLYRIYLGREATAAS
jgi:putative transposase